MDMNRPVLDVVRGAVLPRPPIWIMRQAGRYLPEYRAVRTKAGSFLQLCYNPVLAAEVSLQPLKRFDLDAAIVFSDILVIPDALGQKVRFEEGEGPVLEAIEDGLGIGALSLEGVLAHLEPVCETINRVAERLTPAQTMIGFCGAPWTVATYMIGGRGSADQAAARRFSLTRPAEMAALRDILVEASALYLAAQVRAGAHVIQIFESWALNLDEEMFRQEVIEPTVRLISRLHQLVPNVPVIGFPRGAAGMIAEYVRATGVDMVGLDYAMPLNFARTHIAPLAGVQGNLDPLRLVVGGTAMKDRCEEIISAFEGVPHIFNLGHGIVPQTPVDHVSELVELVKGSGEGM
ncbi:MAG: uroporphyrinogen decarboxylase [Alphaproteobacteria bacterium]|nr:uroporphyrinogen decarboxylase [Alphaproteobacteria bacterium]